MKLIKHCTGKESKLHRPVVVAVILVFFMYFAGEAVGEFVYNITH
ncbi:hypothetical protein [uncultured Pontibacter sp.]|nr:hypothetical protein [uncultured Pontibacter sp.]